MSKWTQFATKFYKTKKRQNKDYKFSQALTDAAKVYNGGNDKKGGDVVPPVEGEEVKVEEEVVPVEVKPVDGAVVPEQVVEGEAPVEEAPVAVEEQAAPKLGSVEVVAMNNQPVNAQGGKKAKKSAKKGKKSAKKGGKKARKSAKKAKKSSKKGKR